MQIKIPITISRSYTTPHIKTTPYHLNIKAIIYLRILTMNIEMSFTNKRYITID
jgi:hypothetical protein